MPRIASRLQPPNSEELEKEQVEKILSIAKQVRELNFADLELARITLKAAIQVIFPDYEFIW